jgi:hypothetical protein
VNLESNISDLAQLLDRRALLTGRRGSQQELLKDVSRGGTARALFEFIVGRRGPRRTYLNPSYGN